MLVGGSSVPEHCTSVLRSKGPITVNNYYRLCLAKVGRHRLIELVSGALLVKALVVKIKIYHQCLNFSLLDLVDINNREEDVVLATQE